MDEGDSEGEGDFPNEDRDGGEDVDEEKTSKPKATSDSDEETTVITKDESITNINSSAKQKNAPKKLMNQFNFFERCALTEEIILRVILLNINIQHAYRLYYNKYILNFVHQDKEVQTTPPTKNDFCTYATQWIIYDAYNEDYLKQQEEKEKEKRDKIAVHTNKKGTNKKKKTDINEDQIEKNMLMTAKFLERIINLNSLDAIAQGINISKF